MKGLFGCLLFTPIIACAGSVESVRDERGQPVKAVMLSDIKAYLTPTASPKVIVVSQNDNQASLYFRYSESKWKRSDLTLLYNEIAKPPTVDRAIETRDTHFTFVPGTSEAWLTTSVWFGKDASVSKTKFFIASKDLGVTWDESSFSLLDEENTATHEGKVLCAGPKLCVYLGLQDPSGGDDLSSTGTYYKVFNGSWCPAKKLPNQEAYFGQSSLLTADGMLDLYGGSNGILLLAGAPIDLLHRTFKVVGCDLVASSKKASVVIPELIMMDLVGMKNNFPQIALGLSAQQGRTPHSRWLVAANPAKGSLILNSVGSKTLSTELLPPLDRVYLNPNLAFDAMGNEYVLFYYSAVKNSEITSHYDLCFRIASEDSTNWSEETCVVRNIPYKSVARNPANKRYGMFDNFLTGAAYGGKKVILFPSDCTSVGDAAQETCHLKLWRSWN